MPARKLTAGAVGLCVALLLTTLVGVALLMLFAQAGEAEIGALLGSAYVGRILRFTLMQACLSTLLSAAFGVLVARAFAREVDFPGRRALLGLMSLPIVLPSLVAVFGIIAIYGQNGWLARALAAAGVDAKPDIYGLAGVVLAHVFFNLPLAVRLLLPGWHSIPVESWRLAAQLGMSGWSVFRLVEWPMLRRYLPHAAATIFMLCVGSFAIVLALGGGPGAATFEVAVFEALRFEFDPPKAAVLALGGLALNLACLALAQGAIGDAAIGSGWRTRDQDWGQRGFSARLLDALLIGAAAFLLAGPVAATLVDGLTGLGTASLDWGLVAKATLTSIGLAVPAALLTLLLALPMVLAEARAQGRQRGAGRDAAGRAHPADRGFADGPRPRLFPDPAPRARRHAARDRRHRAAQRHHGGAVRRRDPAAGGRARAGPPRSSVPRARHHGLVALAPDRLADPAAQHRDSARHGGGDGARRPGRHRLVRRCAAAQPHPSAL